MNVKTLKTAASASVKDIIQASSGILTQPHLDTTIKTYAALVLSNASTIGDSLVGLSTDQGETENLLTVIRDNAEQCLVDNASIAVDDNSLGAIEAILALNSATGVLSDVVFQWAMLETKSNAEIISKNVGRAALALIIICGKLNIDFLEALTMYYNAKKDGEVV